MGKQFDYTETRQEIDEIVIVIDALKASIQSSEQGLNDFIWSRPESTNDYDYEFEEMKYALETSLANKRAVLDKYEMRLIGQAQTVNDHYKPTFPKARIIKFKSRDADSSTKKK